MASIRHYPYPRAVDLSPGLKEVLQRNGMLASIAYDGKDFLLVIRNHDSAPMSYPLTEKQVENLMGWGSTYINKRAYETFVSLVRNDFDVPQHFTAASNAFGRVAMGLHGKRIGMGEYGYYGPYTRYTRGWGGGFLGWTPYVSGYHMRRYGSGLYHQADGPVVPVRPDGRLRPGEMNSGAYGFYAKQPERQAEDELLDLINADVKAQPYKTYDRPTGEAIPYSQQIKSEVYFKTEEFLKVMASHGVIIDKDNKQLTIESLDCPYNMSYDLTDEEIKILTARDVTGQGADVATLQQRLDTINQVIGKDFDTAVTKDMLESRELVSITLNKEVEDEINAEQERRLQIARQEERERELQEQERQREQERSERIANDPQAVDGRDIAYILGAKGWFTPIDGGRRMDVGEIRVDQDRANGKYLMSMELNGQVKTREISQKDFERFLNLDDQARLKMADKFFDDIKIKSDREAGDDMYYTYSGYDRNTAEEATSQGVSGQALQEANARKGFYREGRHGREVEVGDIRVEQKGESQYRMTAVINGQSISHDITAKQYDRFMQSDDYNRVRLFAKIFDEVDIKTKPGDKTNIGAAILAALVAGTEAVATGMGVLSAPRPELYQSHYYKPGVVSAADMAAANFMRQDEPSGPDIEQAQHRGMGGV